MSVSPFCDPRERRFHAARTAHVGVVFAEHDQVGVRLAEQAQHRAVVPGGIGRRDEPPARFGDHAPARRYVFGPGAVHVDDQFVHFIAPGGEVAQPIGEHLRMARSREQGRSHQLYEPQRSHPALIGLTGQ